MDPTVLRRLSAGGGGEGGASLQKSAKEITSGMVLRRAELPALEEGLASFERPFSPRLELSLRTSQNSSCSCEYPLAGSRLYKPETGTRGVSWPVSAACERRWLSSSSRSLEAEDCLRSVVKMLDADAERGALAPPAMLDLRETSVLSLAWQFSFRSPASRLSSVPVEHDWRLRAYGFP